MINHSGFQNIALFYFADRCRDEVSSVLKNMMLEVHHRKNEDLEVEEWWDELQPDVVLAEYQSNYDSSYRDIIKNLAVPLIFIINPQEEEKVLKLIQPGANDYLFKDRLLKLPVLLNVFGSRQNHNGAEESEKTYRSIFENSIDGILLTVPDGGILAANPAACRMFQMTEKELCRVGRSGIVDVDHSSHSDALNERERTGKVTAEVLMKRKDGSRFISEVTSSVFTTPNGKEQTSIIIRDISKFKKAQEQLQLSRQSYEDLFKNNPLPHIIYDVDNYEILEANQAAVKYYNYSYEDFLKLTVLDFLPEENISCFKEYLLNNPENSKELVEHKMVHIKKGSSRVSVQTYTYNLRYQNRNCRLVTCLDVSEKEAALQKLKDQTEKLLSAEKLAKLGYWEVGLQENYFFWSDEVYRIWGRRKEEFQASLENFEKSIYPEDLEKFRERQVMAINGTKELDYEHRIILPNGEIKWVHEKGKVIIDENGRPLRFEGSVQDVNERKKSLEKLVQSEARQRGILQSQTNYLIRTDLEGNYSYCNEKFAIDFRWIFSDKKILGKHASESIHPYHRERVQEKFDACILNPNVVYQVEMDKLQADGGAKTTLWDFVCLTDINGDPMEVQCVGIDITDRVKAEEALKESNIRYELVSKATSDAIYDWNLQSNILLLGDAFYIMFGYSPEEFPQTIDAFMEKIHPEERHQINESLTRGIEGSENHWKAEYRFKKADGKYASVIEKGFILRDENGKAFRMVGAIQDVTEKKKLEELLDEASKFSRIGSFEIDFEKDTMYWSPMTKEIHEVNLDYIPTLEKGILFYKEGESRNVMSNAFTKALNEGESYDLELQIITAKGNNRWIRKIGRPTFINGKCIRINGSFQDITNIKNSELEALKASEEREVILESIGDAFFMVDKDWTVTYWNKHSDKLLGSNQKEILGRNIWDVFPDAVDTKFYTRYHKAVKGQSIEDFEEFFESLQKWFEVTAYPSKSGLSVYFRDVTERKENELQIIELNKTLKAHTEELVTANKGLEQFSYIISHNLRAPVANIIGLGDLIQEDYPSNVKKKFQEELLSNVKRLDNIIRDLNDILQVKVNMSEKKEPLDLEELVGSIKLSIDQVIQNEKVEIITDFTEVPVLNSVRTYLHSIFYNLIFNSIKYRQSHRSPVIKIKSRQDEGKVILIFEDNGIGIDLKKRGSEVFGLYKRFHHHVEGKGMGLFMVKTQVDLMGGKISLTSEVNEGSIFTIEFIEGNSIEDLKNEEAATIYCN